MMKQCVIYKGVLNSFHFFFCVLENKIQRYTCIFKFYTDACCRVKKIHLNEFSFMSEIVNCSVNCKLIMEIISIKYPETNVNWLDTCIKK